MSTGGRGPSGRELVSVCPNDSSARRNEIEIC
jgi:hypothetical protein